MSLVCGINLFQTTKDAVIMSVPETYGSPFSAWLSSPLGRAEVLLLLLLYYKGVRLRQRCDEKRKKNENKSTQKTPRWVASCRLILVVMLYDIILLYGLPPILCLRSQYSPKQYCCSQHYATNVGRISRGFSMFFFLFLLFFFLLFFSNRKGDRKTL